MSDLIDRQAAVKALEETKQSDPFNRYEYQNIGIDWSIDSIKALPSAQTGRKKGKWIYNSPVTMKCNQCGFVIKDWDWHRFKYCPNCIADMRGESDE